METTEIIGCNLFESENYGGWKILTDKLIPTIRANKVCSGIIEVIHMGKTDIINIGGYLEMEGGGRQPNILEIKKMDIEKLGHLEKGTGEHQSNIIYNSDGLSSCVCAGIGVKQQPTMTVETKIIGNLDENSNQRKQVYEKDMVAPTLQAAMGNGGRNVPLIEEERLIIQKCGDRDKDGNYSVHNYSNCIPSNPMSDRGQMLLEKSIVAMRGRNPENPSDRTAGIHLEQRLEQNTEGISNALTSVQKDNLVLEKSGIHVGDFFGIIETEKVDALRMVRTEEGKVLRKSYENGELHHGFNEYRTEEPRNDGCTNTLSTVQKDNKLLETKKIKIRQATKEGFIDCEIGGVCDLNYPTSQTRRGRVQENGQVSPTLTTESIPSVLELADPEFYNFLYLIDEEIYMIRIRKLIPLECWRLMNFSDEDFFKAQKVNSNTQLYKQAGNSIVINVLVAILGNLFEGKEKIYMNNILK